jgi:hypothetical protein
MALALVGCGSNPSVIPAGDFSGPTGLAVAPLADRDLLFIANQGSNELRAMSLCTAPAGTSSTCSSTEDQQLLPAPIPLFPGSITVGQRPVRLAGAPLTAAGNTPHGAVLVIGSDKFLRVVDAASVFAASRTKPVQAGLPQQVALPEIPVDVVAGDVPGPSVTAVVATLAGTGVPAALTVFDVALDAKGVATPSAPRQQCALDFVPGRLALVPGLAAPDGRPQFVYVADGTPDGTPGGTGDGAVEFSVAAIPAVPNPPGGPIPPCPAPRRLAASDPADSPRRARPLRSLALSPAFVGTDGLSVAAGTFLLGATATDKALCTDHGTQTCPAGLNIPAGAVCADHGTRSCGRGRLILIRTNVGGQSQLLRAPAPSGQDDPAVPMVPLSARTPASEVAFIARASCPPPTTPQECTALRLLSNTPAVLHPPIIGVASTEDGTTVFLDVRNRRFFNDARDTGVAAPIPTVTSFTLTPGPSNGASPTVFTFAAVGSGPSQSLSGWMNAGVTRSAQWRAVWHGVMPGLESLSGDLSRAAGSPTVSLRLPPGNSLAPWTSSRELQLGAASACSLPYPQCVGDFVRVLSYSRANTCSALGTAPSTIDLPIAAIDADGLGMRLQAVSGFDPGPDCFASPLRATVEVHAGTTTAGPWTVFEGLDALGRLPHGQQYVITGPRFDYPLDPTIPPPGRDIVLSFTLSGPQPDVAGTFWSVVISDGQAITGFRDASSVGLAGFGGPMVVYTSPRRTDAVVFTALTGSNSLAVSVPAQFGLANSVRFVY